MHYQFQPFSVNYQQHFYENCLTSYILMYNLPTALTSSLLLLLRYFSTIQLKRLKKTRNIIGMYSKFYSVVSLPQKISQLTNMISPSNKNCLGNVTTLNLKSFNVTMGLNLNSRDFQN